MAAYGDRGWEGANTRGWRLTGIALALAVDLVLLVAAFTVLDVMRSPGLVCFLDCAPPAGTIVAWAILGIAPLLVALSGWLYASRTHLKYGSLSPRKYVAIGISQTVPVVVFLLVLLWMQQTGR